MNKGIEERMDYTGKTAFGRIKSGIDSKTSVLRIIDFVYSQLPYWRDDASRPKESSENKLNLDLSKFLNTIHTKDDFPMVHFAREEYQDGHSAVDISASPKEEVIIGARIFRKYDPLVVFECKRLPTPGHNREKEYVTGLSKKGGGIQRFKIGLHGAKHDIVALIGYLQTNSPSYWFNEINQWINQLCNGTLKDICVWNMSEMLECFEEDSTKGIATCCSTHDRSGNVQSNTILIRHLWISMYK